VLIAAAATAAQPVTAAAGFQLQSTIAFTSTRDADPATPTPLLTAAEVYLMNPTSDPATQDARRLTNNSYGDGFPTLSHDGKKIVFDSNRCVLGAEGCPPAPLFDTAATRSRLSRLTRTTCS
jgi:hypothetical protein